MKPTAQPVIAWHVTSELWFKRVIARGANDRLRILRTALFALRHAPPISLAIVDTHMHFLIPADRVAAARAVRALEAATTVAHGLEDGFARAHFQPVRTQVHLRHAFWYVARQSLHHGSVGDPFLEGNLLLDLLGLRLVMPQAIVRLRETLPRVQRRELLGVVSEHLDLVRPSPRPALDALHEAGAAALGRATVPVRGPHCAEVRAAMLRLGDDLGLKRVDVAARLGIASSTVADLRRRPVSPTTMLAVTGQLLLRQGRRDDLQALLLPPAGGAERA